MKRKVLITGGLGFIGSNLVKYWHKNHPDDHIHILDCETYAARPEFIKQELTKNVTGFWKTDIRKTYDLSNLFKSIKPDIVFHLAAESHVCNSLTDPRTFLDTNIVGTFNLVDAIRLYSPKTKLIHVSTDEVFGELNHDEEPFNESTQIKPRSPYAASKAASDHIVFSYAHSYSLDFMVTNCSNNFGPNQHEEKLIPKTISKVLNKLPITIYGDGSQIRDWLHVDDHCGALDKISQRGLRGERYCIGGNKELSNLEMVNHIIGCIESITQTKTDAKLIHTNDRPTDDRRYAVNTKKIEKLGWTVENNFSQKLLNTVSWYLNGF